MSKWKEVAALFNLEPGERFKLAGRAGVFYFDKELGLCRGSRERFVIANEHLEAMLFNPRIVKKLSRWKPEYNEPFYFVGIIGKTVKERWYSIDNVRTCCNDLYDIGNCFRTRKEAEKVAEEIKDVFKKHREGRG